MSIIDNKTRDTLERVIFNALPSTSPSEAAVMADAVLRSPKLLVASVPDRYQAIGNNVFRFLEITTTEIASFIDAERAREYADYLNSKESK